MDGCWRQPGEVHQEEGVEGLMDADTVGWFYEAAVSLY